MIWSDVRVLPTARSLLIALVLAFSGVILAQMPAHACTCVTSTVKQQVNRADLVFSGVVLESNPGDGGRKNRDPSVYEIEAGILYKGDLTRPDVEVTSPGGGGTCGLGDLRTDRPYLFFVAEDGQDLTADTCSGTARAGNQLTGKVQALLGDGTDLTPREEPEQGPTVVEFTRVADAEPETLTRIAAPGAALVLLGLLGLFVVRRATARD